MLILPPESCIQVDSRLALYELLQILRRRARSKTPNHTGLMLLQGMVAYALIYIPAECC